MKSEMDLYQIEFVDHEGDQLKLRVGNEVFYVSRIEREENDYFRIYVPGQRSFLIHVPEIEDEETTEVFISFPERPFIFMDELDLDALEEMYQQTKTVDCRTSEDRAQSCKDLFRQLEKQVSDRWIE